jgi:glycosyltransferase involved in cell wall biosynthesis
MTPKGPIAYSTGEYPRASDTFVLREILALRRLGFEVLTHSVRATDPSHHVGEEQKAEHATTFHIQKAAMNPVKLIGAHLSLLRGDAKRWFRAMGLARRICPPGLKEALWQVFYFLEAGVLAARLKEKGVVHLHNHFANSSCSVAMLAAEMADIPFSFTLHGPSIFFEPMKWRIDEKIARASFVACISHYCRAQGMIFADPKHWEKMRIVHCGVEPAKYGTVDRTSPGKHLIFVGRLAPIKGVSVLLEAFARTRDAHPDAQLTLVGDGPLRGELEARARALGLTDSVTFTGYIGMDEVARRLDAADIFVLPSFAEGVPVVLMEAMAARMPVIGPKVAGVEELVEDGVSGFAVPPGDIDTLAARINDLLTDAGRRAEMGVSGRNRVEEAFDADKEAAKLAALITHDQDPAATENTPVHQEGLQ